MMAEAEAMNGIFAPDAITSAWYRAKGIEQLPYPPFAPGADATYEIDETMDLGDVMPMVAKPFSPGNAFAAEDVARERLPFDKAMIGSCTNGSYDDLLTAALVIRGARKQGSVEVREAAGDLSRIGRRRAADRAPGSAAGRRVDRERVSIGRRRNPAVVVRAVLRPGSGRPACGRARDYVVQSQLAEPHGPRRRGYLASPAVVAASALVGYMAPPSELGLQWDPEEFGV
jgi:aconitate hydratase